jgi:hypothetical protein
MKTKKQRSLFRFSILAVLCAGAGFGAMHPGPAQAWPYVSYDQFDGEYFPVACGTTAPKASLNVIVGHIQGDPLDPLGIEPNPDGTDKPPMKVVGVPLPLLIPIPVRCEDGRSEVDLQKLAQVLIDSCQPLGCSINGQQLADWVAEQSILTSPGIESIEFDWHRNQFTPWFRTNASSTRYTFEDGHEVTVLDTLFLSDSSRGFFTNFVNNGGYTHLVGDLEDGFVCATGMLMHTEGKLDVSGDVGVATIKAMTLPMLNCALETAENEYIGVHISVATEYSFVAEQ